MGNEYSSFNCEATLNSLRENISDQQTARRGLRRIYKLAENDQNKDQLGNLGKIAWHIWSKCYCLRDNALNMCLSDFI